MKRCPHCRSVEVELYAGGQTGSWRCRACGYLGPMILEDDPDDAGEHPREHP